jgi:hypothetical protein
VLRIHGSHGVSICTRERHRGRRDEGAAWATDSPGEGDAEGACYGTTSPSPRPPLRRHHGAATGAEGDAAAGSCAGAAVAPGDSVRAVKNTVKDLI